MFVCVTVGMCVYHRFVVRFSHSNQQRCSGDEKKFHYCLSWKRNVTPSGRIWLWHFKAFTSSFLCMIYSLFISKSYVTTKILKTLSKTGQQHNIDIINWANKFTYCYIVNRYFNVIHYYFSNGGDSCYKKSLSHLLWPFIFLRYSKRISMKCVNNK